MYYINREIKIEIQIYLMRNIDRWVKKDRKRESQSNSSKKLEATKKIYMYEKYKCKV